MRPAESPLLWWSGYPLALILSCAIELPAYLLAFASLGWCRRRPRDRGALSIGTTLALALAVNLLTHPVLWYVALRLTTMLDLMLAEFGVAMVEGLVIFAVVVRLKSGDSWPNRLGWSLLIALGVNTLSLLVGLLALPTLIGLA